MPAPTMVFWTLLEEEVDDVTYGLIFPSPLKRLFDKPAKPLLSGLAT